MGKYTKQQRQTIVREFATRHNGLYNPALFVEEVRASGPSHPAYDWFEWDESKAAKEHQLWQAREFVRDLRVSFSIEEVGRDRAISVRTVEMPAALSPMDVRSKGGGYVMTSPGDDRTMSEYCRQAAAALDAWLRRYGAALSYAGASSDGLLKQIKVLETAASKALAGNKAA